LAAGKHVLCEKPLARDSNEAAAMVVAAADNNRLLKVGFNYRYMPHVEHAKALIDAGEIGSILFMRCRFGHGGRPGYEREWHTDRDLSGGGVLLEQGIHIIDLSRFLVGEPERVFGDAQCGFWPLRQGVEENFFCFLKTSTDRVSDIHVSWTQWVNTLVIEIYGTDGYLVLQGRENHYGPPRLSHARRNPDHSRPNERTWQYEPGLWWEAEWRDFCDAIGRGTPVRSSGEDGLRAQQIIDAAYASAREGKWVSAVNDVAATALS